MSQFASIDLDNLYVNSACVTGPTIDNLMTGPCVNEEYQEPHFGTEYDDNLIEYLLKDELDEIVEEYLREEEERYDEMIAADRLKDIDFNEHVDNYKKYFEERETELLKQCQDEDLNSYFKVRAMRWRKHWQKENKDETPPVDYGFYDVLDYNKYMREEEEYEAKLDKAVCKANGY